MVKSGDGADACLVATLCNNDLGYIPTRDMFYDTINESRTGTNKLDKEAGYLIAE